MYQSWQVAFLKEAVADHGSQENSVYHSWQVRRPEEAVSGQGFRESKLACIIAGKFVTQRRRFLIIARAAQRLRESNLADSSPRGGGFGS